MLSPKEFSNLYKKKWTEEFNLVANEGLESTWEVLADAFNDCIKLNNTGERKRLVVPMPTGSGKSTGLELYLQNLDTNITALVVVYFIDTADELVNNINKKVNPNSAIAIHSKNENTIDDSQERQILVVTHQHYIRRLDEDHIKRDLVVIDESIDLLRETSIKQRDLNRIKIIIESHIMSNSKLKEELTYIERYIGLIGTIYHQMHTLNKKIQDDMGVTDEEFAEVMNTSSSEFLIDDSSVSNKDSFPETKQIIRQNSCSQILTGNRYSNIHESELKLELLAILNDMESFYDNWFYYYGTSQETASLNKASIVLPPQSVVILDATSTTNYLYQLFEDVKLYSIERNTRSYSNVTMHCASGIKTGKSSMIGTNSDDTSTVIATATVLFDNLLAIENLTPESKVLIVTHKALESYLMSFDMLFEYDVSHFGDLTGKNNWQHYDTVVIYGLMHKPKPYVINRHAVAVSPINAVDGSLSDLDVRSKIENTDLASEVIQAINRVRCRNVIDIGGNCKETNIYITLPSGNLADAIISEIKDKMPNIKVCDWDFKTEHLTRTSRKKSNRLDEIVSYIKNNIDSYDYLEASKVRQCINIASSTFNDLLQRDYFEIELKEHNIIIQQSPSNKRQKIFLRDKS